MVVVGVVCGGLVVAESARSLVLPTWEAPAVVLRLPTSHLGVSCVRSYATSLSMRSGSMAPGGGRSRGRRGRSSWDALAR